MELELSLGYKKILITGNAGYIGSHLTKILQKKQQYQIHGLDKNNPVISVAKQHNINIKNNFVIDEEYDCVIHLAAEVAVGRSVKTPALYYTTNILGTLNVLKNIKTKNFICASTGAAEGMQSPYGISKRAMEDIVQQYCNECSIPYTIFRFYNVIGSDGINPTNPDGLFYNLISAITTGNFNLYGTNYNTPDGTCIRDYVHVNEICNAINIAITNPSNSIENLGHGRGHSVKEIIEIFKKVNHCDFNVTVCDRRPGDLEKSVLEAPSIYMEKLFSVDELLKIR
jgi:UDP-glucose 4-epimerase